ncbi:ABC transporter permease [Myxococcota bacterium]|nr:ABC transporter permease [Myxococcota bacterium]
MIRLIRRQCRRALTEAGPAVIGAAALAAFALLVRSQAAGAPLGQTGIGAPASAWPREGAPLVTALVACGPLAAARAGELARMRLQHQLDALRASGGSVSMHLVVPRLLAAAIALPLLVLVADATGFGLTYLDWVPGAPGWISAGGVAPGDVAIGLARAALFGLTLAGVACIAGLTPPHRQRDGDRRRRARSVGRATARAGAGGVVAVLGLHLLLGGGWPW